MKELGYINGFPVVSKTENNVRFLSCHGSTIPAFHLVHMVRLVNSYEKAFGIDKDGNRTTEHILNDLLFGMVCDFRELLDVYNKL